MTQQPWGYPPPQAPQQPSYGQHLMPGWETRQTEGDGVIDAAFDFTFTRYATPGLIKIMYVLSMIVIALYYMAIVIAGFAAGGPFLGIVAIIAGLIPAFLSLLGIRAGLEAMMATVRTAIDIRALRDRYVGPAA